MSPVPSCLSPPAVFQETRFMYAQVGSSFPNLLYQTKNQTRIRPRHPPPPPHPPRHPENVRYGETFTGAPQRRPITLLPNPSWLTVAAWISSSRRGITGTTTASTAFFFFSSTFRRPPFPPPASAASPRKWRKGQRVRGTRGGGLRGVARGRFVALYLHSDLKLINRGRAPSAFCWA